MTVVWFLLSMAAVIALIIGLVRPAAVVRWAGPPTSKRALRTYGALALVFFIALNATSASAVTLGAVRVSSASHSSSEQPTGLIPVTVVKDIDGDTIDVRMPDGTVEPVRMLLIDTPETVDPKTPVEPYGPQASSFCKQKLPVGKRVYLEEGIQKWDKYHRLLAYVWITPSDMYNEDVVRAGLARVAYVYAPNTKYLSRLEADEAYAKSHHLGIWTIPGYVTPQGYNLAAVRGRSTAVASVSRTSSKATPIRHASTRSSGHTTTSGLTVVSSRLNVARGDEASVTIKTRPGATGTITVRYKSGPSHAKGLTPKRADSRGLITWTWVVGTHTTPGNWPVYISAAGKTVTLTLHVH